MPGGDRSGPMGQGPATGRGRGPCESGFARGPCRGIDFARGFRRGFGVWCGSDIGSNRFGDAPGNEQGSQSGFQPFQSNKSFEKPTKEGLKKMLHDIEAEKKEIESLLGEMDET